MKAESALRVVLFGLLSLAAAASRALPIHFGEMVDVGSQEAQSQPLWQRQSIQSSTEASSTAAIGWVYYNFYATTSCQGGVTYVTGLPMNTCLPPSVLNGRDTTSVSYNSFMLVNGTADCSALGITYYSDSLCTVSTASSPLNSSFPTCRPASSLGLNVTNMLSFQGSCSLNATQLPTSSSSFLRSSYQHTQVCGNTAIQSLAYALNSCFGTNEGTSTLYSYSSSQPNVVSMTSYYSNSQCYAEQAYQSSTLGIPVSVCRNDSGQLSANASSYTSVYLSPDSSSDSGLSDGEIAGITVGVVAGVGLIAAGAYAAAQSGAAAAAAAATAATTASGSGAAATGAGSGAVALGPTATATPTANPMAAGAIV